MKKIICLLAMIAFITINVNAQTEKDGTPDVGNKANKQMYGSTYTAPSYTMPSYSMSYSVPSYSMPTYSMPSYSQSAYVQPQMKTTPDNNKRNNKGTRKVK